MKASCSCPVGPVGESGAFCKHCIAVALALLEGELWPGEPLPPAPAFSLADVKEYLDESEKGVLIRFLLERMMEDEDLRDHLFLRMRRRRKRTSKRSPLARSQLE